jgi:hypothetical protein
MHGFIFWKMSARTERTREFKEQMLIKHVGVCAYLGYVMFVSNLITYILLPVTKGQTNITTAIE